MENNKVKIIQLEKELWKAADQLRGNLSSENYMHVVLGIITLKYINDRYTKICQDWLSKGNLEDDLKDKDIFESQGAFIVPEKAKWNYIMKHVGTQNIGETLDTSIIELAKENKSLEGVFEPIYNKDDINKTRLGEVVKIFDKISITEFGEDVLGRVYEYFLGEFFLKMGQKGGEFYTPTCIVKLIVSIIKPYKGKIYDPACGSGGMLVQAKNYIQETGGNINNITVYGQEYNSVTWKIARLNLILNGFNLIDGEGNHVLGKKAGDTFTNDLHKNKEFDFVMANPPFNFKQWWHESLIDDPRWQYGIPSKNNGNYAWLSHILFKLSPKGKAGVVLSNGSLTDQGKEQIIRKQIVESNKVSCIISLPNKLFYNSGISASIWFFENNKKIDDILFINCETFGTLIEGHRTMHEITDENIKKIVSIYDDFYDGKKIDIPGIAKSVSKKTVEENNYLLLPGNYITIPKKEAKDLENIKQSLKNDINDLIKLMDDSKELEKDVFDAIKKIDLD